MTVTNHPRGGNAGVRVYATTYPDEVDGMVLVAQYPDIELFDIDATFVQLRKATELRPMPLVVLSADELLGPTFPDLIASGAVPSHVPPDFGDIVDAATADAQARLAQLAPDAVHGTDTNSGHDIHLVQPQLVVEAIDDVLASIDHPG